MLGVKMKYHKEELYALQRTCTNDSPDCPKCSKKSFCEKLDKSCQEKLTDSFGFPFPEEWTEEIIEKIIKLHENEENYHCAECDIYYLSNEDSRACPECGSLYTYPNKLSEQQTNQSKTLIKITCGLFAVCLLLLIAQTFNKDEQGIAEFETEIIQEEQEYPPKITPLKTHKVQIKRKTVKGRWAYAKVTAYTTGVESCGDQADGITANGTNANNFHCANDAYGLATNNKLLPFGTKIYIDTYHKMLQSNNKSKPKEIEKVDDTGSAMRNFKPFYRQGKYIEYHIDVRFMKVSTARQWGIQYKKVFIFSEE